MSTTDAMKPASPELDWLLENLRGRTPGIGHVLVLSKDGLKICHTAGLEEDTADQFAAIAAGIQSLGLAASRLFGSTLGAGQAMVEFPGGLLLAVPAGEGAVLAVVAAEDADVGMVGHSMYELVEQIGTYLTAPPRTQASPKHAAPPRDAAAPKHPAPPSHPAPPRDPGPPRRTAQP